ncbi:hypothetical protein [Streptomyces pratensis]|uniref:hypothetical protein n=1 Tax=Streptomyces pratensis TaxID=1169025 RepID=UPI003016D63B
MASTEPDELYSHTPSQAEGERDDSAQGDRRAPHQEVSRTEPSQAEGERGAQ